jgi:hypothetical protein
MIIALAVLETCDVLTTNHVVMGGGFEANPLVAYQMALLGPFWWLPKVWLVLLIGLALPRAKTQRARSAFIIVNVLYGCVVLNNLINTIWFLEA